MKLYLLLLLIIIYLIIDCIKTEKIENFSVKKEKKKSKKKAVTKEQKIDSEIVIKKTNKYKLVFKAAELFIWEPEPIDNYFPLGQIVTTENTKPETISVLVKFNKENKPVDYTLKTMIDKKYGVWVPKGKENIRFLSYIISKNKPSLNRVQGISSKFTEETEIEELITKIKLNLDDTEIKTEFWKIHHSPFFTTDDEETHYYLPETNIKPNKLLNVKSTKKYDKIWSNQKNNKTVSIWRPIADEDYRILGDIILNNNTDPNNIIETPTVHKSNCKDVLYFDPKPLCHKTKDTEVCFWKPHTHDGYTTTGDIVTTDKTEPSSDMLSSIPLEYVEENNKIVNKWSNNNINLWSNNYSLFSSTKYTKPNGKTYNICNKFIDYERDPTDKTVSVTIEFIPKNIGHHIDLENKIITTLSNKLDIEPNRIMINNIDKINHKINISIKEKRIDSIDEPTAKVISELVDIIYKNKIKIHDKTQIILILENILLDDQKETIALDNNLFKDFVDKS